MDGGRIVPADLHVKLVDMIGIEIFPELVAGLGEVVFFLKNFSKTSLELSIEISVANHVPCIGPADPNFGDAVVGVGFQTPFRCLALVELC